MNVLIRNCNIVLSGIDDECIIVIFFFFKRSADHRDLPSSPTRRSSDLEPSLLPGWTRGHVLTHVARNGDGLGNLLRWARTGTETPMYASREARRADIEAGAGRSAAEIGRAHV